MTTAVHSSKVLERIDPRKTNTQPLTVEHLRALLVAIDKLGPLHQPNLTQGGTSLLVGCPRSPHGENQCRYCKQNDADLLNDSRAICFDFDQAAVAVGLLGPKLPTLSDDTE